MTDPREALARIKARAEEATSGPWTHGQATYGIAGNGPDHVEISNFTSEGVAALELHPDVAADAEFITHARTDVPRLAEALESVLDLAAAWDAVADDMNETAWPHDFRWNAIHAVTADMRDAITNAFNEEDH